MKIFSKEYNDEDLSEMECDVVDLFDERINPDILEAIQKKYPKDGNGFSKARYKVTIEVI